MGTQEESDVPEQLVVVTDTFANRLAVYLDGELLEGVLALDQLQALGVGECDLRWRYVSLPRGCGFPAKLEDCLAFDNAAAEEVKPDESDLASRVSDLEGDCAAMGRELTSRIVDLSGNCEAMGNDLASRVNELKVGYAASRSRLDHCEEGINGIGQAVEALQVQQRKLERWLENLAASVGDMKKDYAELRKAVISIEMRLAAFPPKKAPKKKAAKKKVVKHPPKKRKAKQ